MTGTPQGGRRVLVAAIVVLLVSCGIAVGYLVKELRAAVVFNSNLQPQPAIGSGDLEPRGLRLARQQCTRCHQLPEPSALPRESWPYVIAWMGNYLGQPDLADGRGPMLMPALIPPQPLIRAADLDEIRAYFVEQAQARDALRAPATEPGPLDRFEPMVPPGAGDPERLVSMARIDAWRGRTLVGRVDGGLEIYDRAWRPVFSRAFAAAPIDVEATSYGYLLDLIGEFVSREPKPGAVVGLNGVGPEVIVGADEIGALHRLVHHLRADLDGDGQQDLVTVSFGDRDGGDVSIWWGRADHGYDRQQLVTRAGPLRAELVDFDGDGRKDLLLLVAQGRNELLLYRGLGGRRFECRQLREWPSAFGLNSMCVADLDRDGLPDVVVMNGNNLELPDVPVRPYHGVHVLRNRGHGALEETFFHPMPGAMCARVADFSGSGRLDIVACACFADWSAPHPETLVYLEQRPDGGFAARSFAGAPLGRWITIDAGDIDGDGRIDLIVGGGHARYGVAARDREAYERLVGNAPSLLVLRNTGR